MGSLSQLLKKSKPFLAVIFVQCGYALMSLVAKSALNRRMSPHVLVAYRMAVATALLAPLALVLERNSRPRMTLIIFLKISFLSLLEPVLDQNMYYMAMKHTTATFTSAMCNILPAMTFLMACIFRLEKVNFKRLQSLTKVAGTLVTVAGAMVMTLIKGPVLPLPWIDRATHHGKSSRDLSKHDFIKGAVQIIVGCFSWSCYIIFQAVVLRSYPAEFSLVTLICLMGMVQCTILSLIVERGNTAVWSIHFDVKLLAAVYGGIVTGLAYYIIAWVMRQKGPVFVSAFNPLNMVIIAILASAFLSEELHLGRVIGAIVIVVGLYLVLWGKSKDRPQIKPVLVDKVTLTLTDEEAAKEDDEVIGKVTPKDEPTATRSNNIREEALNPDQFIIVDGNREEKPS